jgi:hypothetical protein
MRRFIDARSQEHGASHNINAAWLALPPYEREKYHAMSKPYLDELKAEIANYNDRIPLSPSVPSEVRSNNSEDEYLKNGVVRNSGTGTAATIPKLAAAP